MGYEVFFDQNSKASGKIEDGWDFESAEIDDPEDKKPKDWVDDKEIDDPEDAKPDGWDHIPEQIRDPEASKPEDWDDEDDGEWEAPLIDNPEYKGEWAPKKIPNEKYDADLVTWDDLTHVGFELWTVNSGSIFDNIYVGDSIDEANALADATWKTFKDKEKAAKEEFDKAKKEKEDEEKKKKDEAEAAKKAEEDDDDDDDGDDDDDDDED